MRRKRRDREIIGNGGECLIFRVELRCERGPPDQIFSV
jgi:hypothetical protein